MQRRSTRTEPLLTPTLEDLARVEKSGRKKKHKPTSVTMGDNQAADNATAARLATLEANYAHVQQQLADQLARNPPQQQAIGDDNKPHAFYRSRSPIITPTLDRNDFELKTGLINLAEAQQFFGRKNENPIDHLDRIESIVATTRINGVPTDYLRCKLFEFSLADKAANWLKTLPPDSLNGWTEVRNAFLDHFFTKTRTALLKSQIQGFKQDSGESFSEAWERFKSYQRECPHHGFTDVQLLNIFYDGVTHTYRTALNAASNGSFMTRSIAGCTDLINNFAESSAESNQEYDRSKGVRSIESSEIAELSAKLDKFTQQHQQGVHPVEPIYEIAQMYEEEEINYVTGQQAKQGFDPNYRNNLLSYRNPNVENPADQVYPSQIVYGANPVFRPMQGQVYQRPQGPNPGIYQPPQLRNQNAPRPQYQFQGPYQRGPLDDLKQQVGLVLTNQEKFNTRYEERFNTIDGRLEALQTHVKKLDTQVAQNAEAIRRQPGVLPGRPDANPRHEQVNAIGTNSEVSNAKSSDSEPLTSSFADAGSTEAPARRSIFTRSVLRPEPNPAKPGDRIYTPRIPFPTEKKEEIPPAVRKENCSVLSSRIKIVQKGDPGEFCLPITIGETKFPAAFCDLGSSLNVMPKALANQLGFEEKDFKKEKFTLSLADGTEKKHLGMIEEIQVNVAGISVPTDFVIIDVAYENPKFLILGRPFLCTTGAVIDCKRETIKLNLGPRAFEFDMQDPELIPRFVPLFSIQVSHQANWDKINPMEFPEETPDHQPKEPSA